MSNISHNNNMFSSGCGIGKAPTNVIEADCQSKIGDINVVDPTGYRLSPRNPKERAQEIKNFHRDYFGDEQAHSCGDLRMIDRDYWNCDLYLRNFFIDHAPVNHITYPQSSSPCIGPDRTRVMQGRVQDERSKKYWLDNLAPNRTCPPRGLPTFQSNCQGAQPQNMCTSTGAGTPSKMCANSSVEGICPVPGEDWSRIPGTKDRSDLKPWISGVNRNIDAESGLRGLEYRNNADCYPNQVCWDNTMCNAKADEEERIRCNRSMFQTYFQDQQCVYPNFTPKLFRNFSRAKFWAVTQPVIGGMTCANPKPLPSDPCSLKPPVI